MKRIRAAYWVILCFIVFVFMRSPLSSTANASGNILLSDTFNAPTLNTQLWTKPTPNFPRSEVIFVNGSMKTVSYLDNPESIGDSGIRSNTKISGDFELQVSLSDLVASPSARGAAEIQFLIGIKEYIILRWNLNEGGQFIELSSSLPQSPGTPANTYTQIKNTSALSLKMARIGASVYGLVDTGSGFGQVVSLPDVSTKSGAIWLGTVMTAGGANDTVSAVFDDVSVSSATLVPSQTSLQITSPRPYTSVNTLEPTFNGKASPGATITITIFSDPVTGTAVADQTGNWSFTPDIPLSPGPHNIVVSTPNATTGQVEVVSFPFVVSSGTGTATTPIAGFIDGTLLLLVLGNFLFLIGIVLRIIPKS